MSEIIGPSVRWVNPLRIRSRREPDGTWTASYSYRTRGGRARASVLGAESKAEAVAELRHSLRMRVTQVGGQWVEVTR